MKFMLLSLLTVVASEFAQATVHSVACTAILQGRKVEALLMVDQSAITPGAEFEGGWAMASGEEGKLVVRVNGVPVLNEVVTFLGDGGIYLRGSPHRFKVSAIGVSFDDVDAEFYMGTDDESTQAYMWTNHEAVAKEGRFQRHPATCRTWTKN